MLCFLLYSWYLIVSAVRSPRPTDISTIAIYAQARQAGHAWPIHQDIGKIGRQDRKGRN